MIQKQAAEAVIIALISEKNKSKKNLKKEESVWNPSLKEENFKKLWRNISANKRQLFINRRIIQELCSWVLFFLFNYEQFNI